MHVPRLAALAGFLVAAAWAGPASAATFKVSGQTVVIQSDGADNFYSYTEPGWLHFERDPGKGVALTPSSPCEPVNGNLSVRCPAAGVTLVSFTGGDGNDSVGFDGLPVGVQATGDAGDDSLSGGDVGDQLSGGAGRDYLDGLDGGDRLDGGADDDFINVTTDFAGDDVRGGPGDDFISLQDMPAGATVSLDDVANDAMGPQSGANVRSDVEGIVGTAFADTLTGNDAENEIEGRGGDDTLVGGAAFDLVKGDEGDDTLDMADINEETADCGAGGNDRAILDGADKASGCEQITFRAADDDRDGSLLPADCDDHNAAIRPGATDKPGNGVDEDCSGGDAIPADADRDGATELTDCDDFDASRHPGAVDVPRNGRDENCDGKDADYEITSAGITILTTTLGKVSRVLKLVVEGLDRGGTAVVTCRGRGCPLARRTIRGTGRRLNLLRLVRGARLRPGTRLEVRVHEPGKTTRVRTLRFRAGKGPVDRSLCLRPGAKRPALCT